MPRGQCVEIRRWHDEVTGLRRSGGRWVEISTGRQVLCRFLSGIPAVSFWLGFCRSSGPCVKFPVAMLALCRSSCIVRLRRYGSACSEFVTVVQPVSCFWQAVRRFSQHRKFFLQE
ncbi:hypothetical protein NDU88_002396 [Pleurodeles waltl]|uniref:Uncharacterized protein n=1 Tax=Pleurodeles waltl TaxID=8319 RepID=A0AAV7VEF8_PLEWA|nr:hypothetical protein NDU88_002396 [Pleurodeles waltl]